MDKDLYKILQVSEEASDEVINAAFRALAEKNHPSSPAGNSALYGEIIAAFEILGNPSRKQEYDLSRNIPFSNNMSSYTEPQISNVGFENSFKTFDSQTTTQESLNDRYISEKTDIQGILNILYEQINFESLNHNPTKARIYQEIYDAINSNINEIETEPPETSSIWQIIQSYKSYLTSHDYRSLKLMIAKRMKISEQEADLAINSSKKIEFNYKKLYFAIGGVFIVFILLVSLMSWISSVPKKDETVQNNIENNIESNNIDNTLSNQPSEQQETQQTEAQNFSNEANVVDIGSPINLRSAPTTKWDNVVSKLSPDQKVEIVKTEANGWYYIKADDKEGYIYAGLLNNVNIPESFPIAETIPNEIKVLDKNHKVYRILKAKDRLVVVYSDSQNYYLKSEKGNLIGISKDAVNLDNKQNSQIPYIDDNTKNGVEFFAVTSQEKIVSENSNTQNQTQSHTEEVSNQTTNKIIQKTEETNSVSNQTKPAVTHQNKPVVKPVNEPKPNNTKKDPVNDNFVPPVIFPNSPATGNSNN